MSGDYAELINTLKVLDKSIKDLIAALNKNKHYDDIHIKHELHSNKKKKVEVERHLQELDIKERR